MSYTFLAGDNQDNGTATNTFTENLGSGSKFLIIGAYTQNGAPIASITVNGTALTSIVDNTVGTSIWAGTATVTGSDSIVMAGTGSVGFGDTMIQVYSATGLNSNTPFSSASGGPGVTTVTTNAAVGYFAFAFIGNNPPVNFTSTTQSPTGTPATQTGVNGNVLVAGDWILNSTGVPGTTFTVTSSGNTQTVVAVWQPASGGTTPVGWQNNARDVYSASPIKAALAPAFISTFKTAAVAGIAWQGPRDHVKLPPSVVYSQRPAFARTPPIAINTNAGIPWFKFPDLPGISERILDSGPAEPQGPPRVPISGMAWDALHESDILPKGRFLTDPAAIAYIPPIVTWSFLVGDTIFLRDAPADQAPGYGHPAFAQPVGISGIGWFAPPDRASPAVRINLEAFPAIALTPATLPVKISGMAWFAPADRDRPATKITFDYPPGFGRPLTAPVNTNAGIPWFEPPDRDRAPVRVNFASAPTFAGLPFIISGMAWFQPPDRYNPARIVVDSVPAQVLGGLRSNTGLGWLMVPSDWRPAATRLFDAPSAAVLLKPATSGISGMAWFEPADHDKAATKMSVDYPPSGGWTLSYSFALVPLRYLDIHGAMPSSEFNQLSAPH